MKNRVLIIMAILFAAIPCFAQEYGFINSSRVNLRSQPSTSGRKVATAYKYDAVNIKGLSDGWYECRVLPAVTAYEPKDYGTVYVKAEYVTPLKSDPIPADIFNSQIYTASEPSDDIVGSISLYRNGNSFDGNYHFISREMRAAGGSGTVDHCEFNGTYDGKRIRINGNNMPILYDSGRNMLLMYNIIWTVEK